MKERGEGGERTKRKERVKEMKRRERWLVMTLEKPPGGK